MTGTFRSQILPRAHVDNSQAKKRAATHPNTAGAPQKAGDLLPGVSIGELRRIHARMSGRKTVPKEALIITAAIKRKEGLRVSMIARHLDKPRTTIHDWLVRVSDRGLDGLADKTVVNHKPILAGMHLIIIQIWLSHSPQAYGFESALWQTSMLRKMTYDRLHIDIKPRTLRNTLQRMSISFRKPRPVPHNSAPAEKCERFKNAAQKLVDCLAEAKHTIFYEDEMAMRLAAGATRGWMPRGIRTTVNTGFSRKTTKVFGALGKDILHVMPAEATNSRTFKIFLEALRQHYGRVTFITDNASYHRSHSIRKYMRSTKGEVVLIYLPKYTPQLNPIEIQWKVIKERLAGRAFATLEKLEDAIIKLVESGEVKPVQISKLPMA